MMAAIKYFLMAIGMIVASSSLVNAQPREPHFALCTKYNVTELLANAGGKIFPCSVCNMTNSTTVCIREDRNYSRILYNGTQNTKSIYIPQCDSFEVYQSPQFICLSEKWISAFPAFRDDIRSPSFYYPIPNAACNVSTQGKLTVNTNSVIRVTNRPPFQCAVIEPICALIK
jgi:hypothetical protein